jgi:tRNA pseudouridine38-40 synthase
LSNTIKNLTTNIQYLNAIDNFESEYFDATYTFGPIFVSGQYIGTQYDTKVEKDKDKIIISLTGNGFLYNMVRIIAGTLLEVGLGNIKPEEIKDIIEAKNRQKAGKTLPPQGLFLMNVEYN